MLLGDPFVIAIFIRSSCICRITLVRGFWQAMHVPFCPARRSLERNFVFLLDNAFVDYNFWRFSCTSEHEICACKYRFLVVRTLVSRYDDVAL